MSNARFSILQARAVKDKKISDAQFRTLAALGMYADQDGWCYPMLSTLGKDLGKSKQAVGRDTIHLRKLGYVEVHARFNENGGRRSNLYRLNFDPPVNVDDSTPSTPEVDTPSTPEVDVNVPYKDPINHVNNSLPARQGTAYNRGEQEKPNAVDEYLRLANAPGMKRETRIDAILSYLGERFHVNTEVKKWKDFAKFVETRQTHHGEQVDVFVSWLLGQKDFNLQYWPPSKMEEFWPMAFIKGDVNPQRAEGVSSGYFA